MAPSEPVTEPWEPLWSLARVRGPLRAPDQDASDLAGLTQGDPLLAAHRVLDALRSARIPPEIRRVDLEIVASDVLGAVLQPAVEALLRDSLDDPLTRSAVLRTFSFGCTAKTAKDLVEIVRSGRVDGWPEGDLVLLVDALWASGADETRVSLRSLATMAPTSRVLQDEIGKALEDLG